MSDSHVTSAILMDKPHKGCGIRMNKSKAEITNFIKENIESEDFTGGVDDNSINQVQDTLDARFPESYKWFLSSYGSGGLFGVNILGVAKSNIDNVVIHTEKYRDLGMTEK